MSDGRLRITKGETKDVFIAAQVMLMNYGKMFPNKVRFWVRPIGIVPMGSEVMYVTLTGCATADLEGNDWRISGHLTQKTIDRMSAQLVTPFLSLMETRGQFRGRYNRLTGKGFIEPGVWIF